MRISLAAVFAAVLAASVVSAPPASAAPLPESCTISLHDGKETCYRNLGEALRAVTGGRASSPGEVDAANNATLAQRRGLPAISGIVVEISYEHAGYTGSSWIWYAGDTCDDDLYPDYATPQVYTAENRITSFTMYAGCISRHWEHTYWSGANHYWSGSVSNIGAAMNDKTSSIEWT